MTDVLDPASLVEAAQKAVGDGDYVAAERLLREAAALQEATLGAAHPDLASTLNNLAFVCEQTNKFDEAERGYRRAHAIAVASLSPGHPLIATSLKNLVEFCAAHEIPIWKPPAAGPDEEAPLSDFDAEHDEVDAEHEIQSVPDVREDEPVVVTRRFTPRMFAVAALVLAAVVVVAFIRRAPAPENTPRPIPETRQESSSNAAPELSKPIPVPPPEPKPEPKPEPEPRVTPERRPDASTAPVTVLRVELCSALEKRGSPDWQCTSASGDLRPGTYFFYTRLLANAATTVEHRWYHAGRVHQVMRLRVAASSSTGYRTFSSNTVSAERTGDWRVELRAADGTVLHQESFVVR